MSLRTNSFLFPKEQAFITTSGEFSLKLEIKFKCYMKFVIQRLKSNDRLPLDICAWCSACLISCYETTECRRHDENFFSVTI